MFRLSRGLAPLLLLLLLLSTPAPAQVIAERIVSGLNFPTFAASPPGDATRMMVLEQPGVVRLVKNGVLQTQPFLDISANVNGGGEQGLLGLAFHPQYATNGWFFLYYIEGAGSGGSVIMRYQVANPDSANPSSAFRVLTLNQPFSNHNGGALEFGPDDYLYFGLGDGGSANDPSNRAQNGMDLLGKILRLDVDGADDFPGDATNNYAIPATNPFVGNASVRDEIWALGVRNPYRFSFDRLTGDLWIGDVGQDCFEEISFAPGTSVGGENYGWDIMEGPDCFNEMPFVCNQGPCGVGLVDPVHSLAHGAGLISITGGKVYRGSAIPAIQGEYFFAEFYTAVITGLRFNGTVVTDTTDWTAALDPPTSNINQITAFAEDANGELYILDAGGEIFQILPDPTYVGGPHVEAPASFGIGTTGPNPFRTDTRFEVRLERDAALGVAVYSTAGRLVRRLHLDFTPAGILPLRWDGRDAAGRTLPAGVYLVRAESEGRVSSARVVFLR